MRRIALSWLAVAIWAALIFVFSAQPSLNTGLGVWDLILRKIAHMGEFGVLCLLVWRALRQHRAGVGKAMIIAAAASFLYAVSDEYHQSFVSGRTASARDVGFDLGGIVIAVIVFFLFLKFRRERTV